MTRTLDILERLIAFPTVSSESNLDLVDWTQTMLQNAGFGVTRIPSACGRKAGLFARIGPKAGGGICLSGHTDVVPTDGQDWTSHPFQMTRSETHVFGRGTTDMKGFVASALALAERVDPSRLSAPLGIVLSYDEEVGCVGIKEMLPTLAPLLGHPRLVIVGEPTSMRVAVGHKGKTALRVRFGGQAGHSALAPNFVNAIQVAARFILEMKDLQDRVAKGPADPDFEIPYSTIHVGKINGGRAVNIVADETTIDMEVRSVTPSAGAEILSDIRAIASSLAASEGADVSISETGAYPGLGADQDQETLETAIELAAGRDTTKVAFGTEAGYFAAMGLNTCIIGPGDMATDGHQPDESLALSQLSQCGLMMDRILAEVSRPSARSRPG
ncbi:acetylornithine deacetylase [Pseudaestuariivita atlantica]|uniref:Acetylornithine deacetylase n=1 Tax=Pseudaestuariivita atlantica TaxID=1317121 RepID=A0A0L1JM50_9RHOB|nr:acetylornithine deacetylase [Pseudaestuariivita atlantica]KNG92836.1 acetylornithine deacetylase [Pseudaestuariivita atlantica]